MITIVIVTDFTQHKVQLFIFVWIKGIQINEWMNEYRTWVHTKVNTSNFESQTWLC
jgi:hypothetical protein